MIPTTTVPTSPKSSPAFLNALGIARIPVPRELFSRCINDPDVLKNVALDMKSCFSSLDVGRTSLDVPLVGDRKDCTPSR